MTQTRSDRKPSLVSPSSVRPARRGLLQRQCACGGSGGSGGKCDECQQKETGLQRLAAAPARSNAAPTIVGDVLRSPGQPLDKATRASLEPRFGHDFSRVRIHTDAKAAESARAVAAHAYTVGSDIVFGPSRYAPGTDSGRRLLAHELTHVVQQGASHMNGPLVIGPEGDDYERQADAIAGEITSANATSQQMGTARQLKETRRMGISRSIVQRANGADDDQSSNATSVSSGSAPAADNAQPGAGSSTSASSGMDPTVDTAQSAAPGAGAQPADATASGCDAPDQPQPNPNEIVFFDNDVSQLNPAQQQQIGKFVKAWNDDGTGAAVRLDGFASPPGTEGYNLTLSCSRAKAVAAEMTNPTVQVPSAPIAGIPESLIRKVGQGATAKFGTVDQNRRVSIYSPINKPSMPTAEPAPTPQVGPPSPRQQAIDLANQDCAAITTLYTANQQKTVGLLLEIYKCLTCAFAAAFSRGEFEDPLWLARLNHLTFGRLQAAIASPSGAYISAFSSCSLLDTCSKPGLSPFEVMGCGQTVLSSGTAVLATIQKCTEDVGGVHLSVDLVASLKSVGCSDPSNKRDYARVVPLFQGCNDAVLSANFGSILGSLITTHIAIPRITEQRDAAWTSAGCP